MLMNNKILRLKKVQEVTGCSKSFIYSNMQSNNFPRQIKLGARAVGWYQSDVEEWMNSRERIGQ
jgi:prophage regulatory protein